MVEKRDETSLDTRLLSDAIIELNISRRNVSIYPREHPAVKQSLSKAYDYLQKLLELRNKINLGIAKDTIVVDEYYLDKKNPVFREFALHLNRLNIAYVTFLSGLTMDELFFFHKILSENPSELNEEIINERLKEEGVRHIKVGFIDYSAFVIREPSDEDKDGSVTDRGLWERYVYGLMTGTIRTGDISDRIGHLPPDRLAEIVNRIKSEDIDEESYDRVITSYMRRASERALSGKDIQRLMDFIDNLRPELKRQFLSSTVRITEKDLANMKQAFSELSVDRIIQFLDTLNKHAVELPETLRNLLARFSKDTPISFEPVFVGETALVDDFFMDDELARLFDKDNFDFYITEIYQKDIQKIIDYDARGTEVFLEKDLMEDILEEATKVFYYEDLIELALDENISGDDYDEILKRLIELADDFINTARFSHVEKLFLILDENSHRGRFVEINNKWKEYLLSPDFMNRIVDSIRLHGRQNREEITGLIDRLGEKIIPALIDALIDEQSQSTRRFLLSLIIHFGNRAIPFAIKRLGDDRWYVKRNMLYIISECGGVQGLPHVKQYCHHENIKVRAEALKALLRVGDRYGIQVLNDLLNSKVEEDIELAIRLAGSFKVKELQGRLVDMLKKHPRSSVDFHKKIPVVRTLGEIGDPSVVKYLQETFHSRSLLFKGALDSLKLEILKSLKNYPVTEEIKEMIETALKSSKEDFQREAACLKRTVLRRLG